jgi:hypothetical protein
LINYFEKEYVPSSQLANFRTKKENSPNANLIAIDVLIAIHFVLLPKKVCPTDHH